jgi:ubiquinone/menaquinone biosynthesis C-methylase UbiE
VGESENERVFKERDLSIVFEMFAVLPRQGPGDDASTARAFALLEGLGEQPEILDVGCGSGTQTMALAHLCQGRITAVDIHGPLIEKVRQKVAEAAVEQRVEALQMSMFELDFTPGRFDVIWAEGSIFVIGFKEGLTAWRPLLKDGGYLVASELTWFRSDVPDELQEYWRQENVQINDVATNVKSAESARYQVIETFELPSESWWPQLYTPLGPRLAELRVKYAGNAKALAEVEFGEREIEMFRKYSDYYGYVFYVMQKSGPS